MSVRKRTQRLADGSTKEVWVVDVKFQHPDGTKTRVRKHSPVQTRRGAEAYERELRQALLTGNYNKEVEPEEEKQPAPKFVDFAHEFLSTYVKTNNKPSEQSNKRNVFHRHLIPVFGNKRLDEIGVRDIERYKGAKLAQGLKPKTINNHLTAFRKMMTVAADWELIETVPRVKWFRTQKPDFDFLDFDEAERLIDAVDDEWRAMILTALKTGLRQGELIALQWDDVDLVAGRLTVRRNIWRGHIGSPKSGKSRVVELSPMVVRALKAHRHLRGDFVFCQEDGSFFPHGQVKHPLYRACRRAGLRRIGWHVMRHTFASHLVMRGVPLRAVQELMGTPRSR